ncbi:MAG: glycosyltransferase [Pseudomonadota bacterium]
MKIIVATTTYPSSSQTFVDDHIAAVRAAGHEVMILVSGMRWSLRSRVQDGPSGPAIASLAPGMLLRLPGAILRGRLPRSWLGRSLRRLFRQRLGCLPQLFTEIALTDPALGSADLIHAHFGTVGRRIAQARLSGVATPPLVTTFHGYDATHIVQTRDDTYYAALRSEGALMHAVSERIQGILIEAIGFEADRCRVRRVGLPAAVFDAPLRYAAEEPAGTGVRESTLRVLMIGRMVEKKGQIYGISAMHLLARLRPDIRVVLDVVGDGPLFETLQRQAAIGPGQTAVHFHGTLPRQRILSLMQEASVLLHPSVTAGDHDEEGIPVVLMEAMALGLPVVSTQHAGIPELIEDGVSGRLVPERDAVALYHALVACQEAPAVWAGYARAAAARVRARHDGAAEAARVLADYREVLSGGTGSPFAPADASAGGELAGDDGAAAGGAAQPPDGFDAPRLAREGVV